MTIVLIHVKVVMKRTFIEFSNSAEQFAVSIFRLKSLSKTLILMCVCVYLGGLQRTLQEYKTMAALLIISYF